MRGSVFKKARARGVDLEYELSFEPIGLQVTCRQGVTIFEATRHAGIALNSIHGGRGMCRQCQVQVIQGDVSLLSEGEKAGLKEEGIATGFRLACQTQPLSDLKVYIPQTSLATK